MLSTRIHQSHGVIRTYPDLIRFKVSRFFGHLPRALIDLNNSMSASACPRQPRSTCLRQISEHWLRASRTSAVFRRKSLAVSPRLLWKCLISPTVAPFPVLATSHPACGFPVLGAPICFVPRFMWPIAKERPSHRLIGTACSR